MRDGFSSVSKDVITASVKKCGFSLSGYHPFSIPNAAYSYGKAYRFDNYPMSDDIDYQKALFGIENITAPPETLNLCLLSPAEITFQENASKREEAQARTDMAQCPILAELDDEVAVAKRAFEMSKKAGLPKAICSMAPTAAIAALNSRSPTHVCDVLCKVSALAEGFSEEEAHQASLHASSSVELRALDIPHDKSVRILWVTPGLKTAEIRMTKLLLPRTFFSRGSRVKKRWIQSRVQRLVPRQLMPLVEQKKSGNDNWFEMEVSHLNNKIILFRRRKWTRTRPWKGKMKGKRKDWYK